MADEVREQQGDRGSLASKPFEELDDAAGRDGESTPLGAAKRAAGTAAAAALAGALAGAAKAFLDRRSSDSEEAPEDEAKADDPADEGGEPPAPRESEEQQPDERAAEHDAPEDGEPEDEADDDSRPEAQQHDESRQSEDDASDDGGRPEGASTSEAASIVRQARAHLQELLDAEPESVSALQRTNGAWTVTLEVVEVRRVPESTDVLASYDVVLEDDGGIVSLAKTRRYRRSQVEGDR